MDSQSRPSPICTEITRPCYNRKRDRNFANNSFGQLIRGLSGPVPPSDSMFAPIDTMVCLPEVHDIERDR